MDSMGVDLPCFPVIAPFKWCLESFSSVVSPSFMPSHAEVQAVCKSRCEIGCSCHVDFLITLKNIESQKHVDHEHGWFVWNAWNNLGKTLRLIKANLLYSSHSNGSVRQTNLIGMMTGANRKRQGNQWWCGEFLGLGSRVEVMFCFQAY